ncbi:glycosyltransferase family 39 protein [Myxococcota bacterium]|nr:glycosyltransferase family 39 protein [Myxococcota bacterium]
MTPRSESNTLLCVALGVAAWVRWLALEQFAGAHLAGDETYYVHLAEAIANGEGHDSAWRPPLYPLFMGWVISLWPSLDAVRWVQILLSVISVGVLFRVCDRRYGARPAFVTGLAAALCPALVHYGHFLWSEALAAPLMAVFVWCADRFDRMGRGRDAFACGVVLGLLALTKEVWVYFGAVVLVWMAWRQRARAARASSVLAACALGLACVVLPWTARNYLQSGGFVLISMNRWFPIAMGNFYPDDDWYLGSYSHDQREALKDRVVSMSGPEYDAMWQEIALELIADHQPWWAFQKSIRGVVGLYNVRSQPLRFLEEGWVKPSPSGAVTLVVTEVGGYYVFMLLGIAALWLVPGGGLKPLVVLAVLYVTGVHLIANATPRFHVPLLPLFAIYIGPLMAMGRGVGGLPRWQRVGAAITLVAFVLIPLPRSWSVMVDVWNGIGGGTG